jgi:hypothetical protein
MTGFLFLAMFLPQSNSYAFSFNSQASKVAIRSILDKNKFEFVIKKVCEKKYLILSGVSAVTALVIIIVIFKKLSKETYIDQTDQADKVDKKKPILNSSDVAKIVKPIEALIVKQPIIESGITLKKPTRELEPVKKIKLSRPNKKSEGKINLKKNVLLNVKQKQPGEDTIQLNEIFELLKKEEKKEKEDCKDEKKVIKVINESKVEEIDTKEKEELKELGKFIKKIVSEEKNNKKDVNNGSLNNDSDDDEEGFVDIDGADL